VYNIYAGMLFPAQSPISPACATTYTRQTWAEKFTGGAETPGKKKDDG